MMDSSRRTRGRQAKKALLAVVVVLATASEAFTTSSATVRRKKLTRALHALPTATGESLSVLSAVAVADSAPPEEGDWKSVGTAALLITGNTVGAGALALPALCEQPGLALSTGMFVAAYGVNLLSGLILAEVAIKQYEAGDSDVPSSFREFAASTMESSYATNAISSVSLFVNVCALTYSLGVAGVVFSNFIPIHHTTVSAIFAALLAVMGATQSRLRISQISSVFVTGLFLSLAALLLPGLPSVQDPIHTFLAPGTASSAMTGMAEAAPIMLTTLIFQNIVPPVAKILDYDRVKTVTAVLIGSFLPLAMYLTYVFCVLGGGVAETPPLILTLFSVTAVTGSAIGCTMAVSEELQAFLDNHRKETVVETVDNGYSWPAVAAAVLVPLGCSTLCHEYADALKLSGGYGIPVLYGAIPVAMAWTQRQKLQAGADLVPPASLGLVGLAFGAFLVNSIVSDLGHVVHL